MACSVESLSGPLQRAQRKKYAGRILIVNEQTDRVSRYLKFAATFVQDNELLPLYLSVGECAFPEAGLYRFEVYFSARGTGAEVLKGEHPFIVRPPVE